MTVSENAVITDAIPRSASNPGTVVGSMVVSLGITVSCVVIGIVWIVVRGGMVAVSEEIGVSVEGRLVVGRCVGVVGVMRGLSFCRRNVTSSLIAFPFEGLLSERSFASHRANTV